jgi:hypothetical protein
VPLIDVWSVDLDVDEWASDINTVASVLKLWLRELPDPLLTRELHQDFITAASQCFKVIMKEMSRRHSPELIDSIQPLSFAYRI